jgi:hypothetical protein
MFGLFARKSGAGISYKYILAQEWRFFFVLVLETSLVTQFFQWIHNFLGKIKIS